MTTKQWIVKMSLCPNNRCAKYQLDSHSNTKVITGVLVFQLFPTSDFWKINRVLAPKCNTVPHCIVNNFGNETTDEGSTVQAIHNITC